MKRYGYYSVKDAKDKLRRNQKVAKKMGKKVDLSELVYKHYKGSVNGSKKFVDDFTSVFKTRSMKDWERNDKVYCALVEIMYDLYLDEIPVHLWVDSDKIDSISVGSLDFAIWNKCKDIPFALEFNTIISSKKHSEAECAIRVLGRSSSSNKDMIQVSIDYYSEEYGFNYLEPVFIDLNDDKVYVSHFNKELNNCKIEFEGMMIDVCSIGIDDFKYELTTFGELNIFTIESITIALQNSIKEYFAYIDSVKTITTVSGAKRKMSKMHEPRIRVREEVKGNDEVYVPISTLAVRKVYEKKPYQGGHHASPIPHGVKGHWRYYKNGKRVWIKPYHKACEKHQEPTGNVNIYVVGK